MSDDLDEAIKSAELWRDSLIEADSAFVYIAVDCVECLKELQLKSRKITAVTVHTDERTIWVNSAERCEVCIGGLRGLKGTQAVKGVMTTIGDNIDVIITSDVEICCECGRSVEFGSGLFVNRVPDFNTLEERKEMGKPHPDGNYMCIECEEKFDNEECVDAE